jgi:hypothetical protein
VNRESSDILRSGKPSSEYHGVAIRVPGVILLQEHK